jgi:hypothetical protein
MTLMTENQMTGMKEKKYQTLKQQSLMTGMRMLLLRSLTQMLQNQRTGMKMSLSILMTQMQANLVTGMKMRMESGRHLKSLIPNVMRLVVDLGNHQ